MGISANQFEEAQKAALEYVKRVDVAQKPDTWLPKLFDVYEKELVRLNEHRELMLVIADMTRELQGLRERYSKLEQALIVIAADDLLERLDMDENEVRKEIAREALLFAKA